MKKVVHSILGLGLLSGLLLVGFGAKTVVFGAKPADNSFGLNKGNKTYEVQANTWNGMYFLNTAGNGHITSVQLLVNDKTPNGVVRMAIYSATPCILYQDLGYANVADGWVSIEGLNIPVVAGSYYHLAFDLQSQNNIEAKKRSSAPDGSYSASWPYDGNWLRIDSAVDMPPGGILSNTQYVMRAIVAPN